MNRYDSTNADCFIYTWKEGALSAVAHDLKLRVTRFQVDTDFASSVVAAFDPTSLEVLCAVRDGVDAPEILSARDRATIEEHILNDVLEPARYPQIRLVSTSVAPIAAGLRVTATLNLHGVARALSFDWGPSKRVQIQIDQRDFGIKPFRAMLGALRVKPEVGIVFVAR